MKVEFKKLKQKDVINLTDGKNLGKVCDLTFTFPEGKVEGFTVTGGKGFRFSKSEQFIPLSQVKKIGKDAVLVNVNKDGEKKEPCHNNPCQPCPPPCPPRRSLDEYE